jgi:hypothetical protein
VPALLATADYDRGSTRRKGRAMEKAFEVSRGEVLRVVAIVLEICRHCGCSENNPCRLCTGESCNLWTTRAGTVCSNPSCVKAEAARKRLAVASRPRRPTSADVHALIRSRGRKRSCKAARPRGLH